MQNKIFWLLAVPFCGLLSGAAACSSSGNAAGTAGSGGSAAAGGSGGATGTTPTITITSPADGDTILTSALVDSADQDVAFTTTHITLKAPGTCAGASGCGHVHLTIDGTDCNDATSTPALPYNAASPVDNATPASPISAGFDYCKGGIPGKHTLKLELRHDDHSPLSPPVSASISVTVVDDSSGAAGAPGAAGAGN